MKLPIGWKLVRLKEVTKRIMVGIASKATHAYRSAGVPMLRNKDIKRGHLITTDLLFLDPEFEKLHRGKRLKSGDVLTVRTGEPGLSAVVPPEFENAQCFTSLITRPDTAQITSEYLCAFINSDVGQQQFSSAEAGGAQKNVNAGTLELMMVPVPPIPEQKWIAEVLGAWDEGIEKIGKLIEAKQKLKRGLMQQILTARLRFLEYRTHRCRQRELAEFFEFFEEANGDQIREPLSCSKVHGIIPQSQKFEKRVASADTSRYQVVRRGDLVYDPMLLWDASIAFVEKVPEGVISPAYATFHFNEQAGDRTFFRELLNCHRMRHWYKVISQGTNARRRKAMPDDFLQIPMPVPDLEEQRRIGELFGEINSQITTLNKTKMLFAEQKRGLMQKLLTGKIRVKVSAAPPEVANV